MITRAGPREPSVLLGQRHRGHAFMPNKFVFPGGRVDARAPHLAGLRPEVLRKLARLHGGACAGARTRGDPRDLRRGRPAGRTARRLRAAHPGSGELLDLRWVPLSETASLDLPEATQFVVAEVVRRVAAHDPRALPVPFARYTRGGVRVESL